MFRGVIGVQALAVFFGAALLAYACMWHHNGQAAQLDALEARHESAATSLRAALDVLAGRVQQAADVHGREMKALGDDLAGARGKLADAEDVARSALQVVHAQERGVTAELTGVRSRLAELERAAKAREQLEQARERGEGDDPRARVTGAVATWAEASGVGLPRFYQMGWTSPATNGEKRTTDAAKQECLKIGCAAFTQETNGWFIFFRNVPSSDRFEKRAQTTLHYVKEYQDGTLLVVMPTACCALCIVHCAVCTHSFDPWPAFRNAERHLGA